jgi:acyl-[acyl carrier protein]--UDP-N-acetylglucosamine O-acyltransferase
MKSKEYLIASIKNLPNDFALSEVKYHLTVEHVEKKRMKRNNLQKEEIKKRDEEKKLFFDQQKTIELLDNIIKDEKLKLKEIKERKNNAVGIQTFFD